MEKRCPKRDAILDYVRSTDSHPAAEQVYAALKQQIPDLALGTVYRNLAKFRQEGIIASLGAVNGVERFDGNPLPHAHFVCRHCNAVIDLPDLVLPPAFAARVSCGRVEASVLTLYGQCNHCNSGISEPLPCGSAAL